MLIKFLEAANIIQLRWCNYGIFHHEENEDARRVIKNINNCFLRVLCELRGRI